MMAGAMARKRSRRESDFISPGEEVLDALVGRPADGHRWDMEKHPRLQTPQEGRTPLPLRCQCLATNGEGF